MLEDIKKFKEIYNYDILNHNIKFKCYQGVYKEVGNQYDMVIADELHDALTPEYFKFFINNKYNHLIGLTATIDNTTYIINNEEVSKKDLLNQVAPVVFKYTVNEGQIDKTARKLVIFVVEHELDSVNKNIEKEYVSNKKTKEKTKFMISEQTAYDYAHSQFIKQIYSSNKSDFLVRYWANQRATVLYKAKSKSKLINTILQYVDRTIVFGNNIECLIDICPTVSSYNSVAENKKILEDFNSGSINTIGSFKMLKQGVNLNNLNNVILHSYYQIQKDVIQRFGRLRNSDEIGFVFIIKTKKTQEEKWYNKMMEGLDSFTIVNTNIEKIPELIHKFKHAPRADTNIN